MLNKIKFDFEVRLNDIDINHSPIIQTSNMYLISFDPHRVLMLGFSKKRFINKNKQSLILIPLRIKTCFINLTSIVRNKRIVVSIK